MACGKEPLHSRVMLMLMFSFSAAPIKLSTADRDQQHGWIKQF